MPTIFMILIAACFYAMATIFISRAAGKIDDYFVNVVIQCVAITLPLVAYLFYKMRGTAKGISTEGVIYGALAGASIAIFSVMLVKIFARGGNLAYVSPAIYGGAIVISSLVGWFVLHETMQPMQVGGVVLVALGIGLIVAAKL